MYTQEVHHFLSAADRLKTPSVHCLALRERNVNFDVGVSTNRVKNFNLQVLENVLRQFLFVTLFPLSLPVPCRFRRVEGESTFFNMSPCRSHHN